MEDFYPRAVMFVQSNTFSTLYSAPYVSGHFGPLICKKKLPAFVTLPWSILIYKL